MAEFGASPKLRGRTAPTLPIELVDAANRTKKGPRSTTYEFVYRHEVGDHA